MVDQFLTNYNNTMWAANFNITDLDAGIIEHFYNQINIENMLVNCSVLEIV